MYYITKRFNILDHKDCSYRQDQFELLDTLKDKKEAVKKYNKILSEFDKNSKIEKKESGECEKWWDVETLKSQYRELRKNSEYEKKWISIELIKTPMDIKDVRIQEGVSYFDGNIYGTNDPDKCKTCLDVIAFCSCGYN